MKKWCLCLALVLAVVNTFSQHLHFNSNDYVTTFKPLSWFKVTAKIGLEKNNLNDEDIEYVDLATYDVRMKVYVSKKFRIQTRMFGFGTRPENFLYTVGLIFKM